MPATCIVSRAKTANRPVESIWNTVNSTASWTGRLQRFAGICLVLLFLHAGNEEAMANHIL